MNESDEPTEGAPPLGALLRVLELKLTGHEEITIILMDEETGETYPVAY